MMRNVPAVLTLALLPVVAVPAHAEVWGYVDERGMVRFAGEQLDERYELFYRGSEGRGLRTPRAVAVPTVASKLIAYFEVSPAYKQVKHHMRDASQAHGVDLDLLKAVIATESGFDAKAVSPKGAVGLMQVMPATAQRWGLKGDEQGISRKLADPATNIRLGTRNLRYLIDRFPGQLELALAAYNAGEGAVLRAGRQVPNYRETRDYVQTVMQLYAMLKPPASLARSSASGRVRVEFPAAQAMGAGPRPVEAPGVPVAAATQDGPASVSD